MPSALKFIIGADAMPFENEFKRMEQISIASSGRIKSNLEKLSGEIEAKIGRAATLGMPTAHLEANLAAVRGTLAAVTAEEKARAAATAVGTAATEANTTATEKNILATANWRVVGREAMVVVRELSRGNWSRIPSSIEILVQNLGILKYLLSPVAIALGAASAAAYFMFRKISELNQADDELNVGLQKSNEAIKEQGGAFERAATHAAEFRDWLKKIRGEQDSLNESTNEQLRIMREKFQFEQQLAEAKGQLPGDRAQAEIKEMQAERDLIAAKLKEQSDEIPKLQEQAAQASKKVDGVLSGGGPEADKAVANRENDIFAKVSQAMRETYGQGAPIGAMAKPEHISYANPTGGGQVRLTPKTAYEMQQEKFDIDVGGKKLPISFAESFAAMRAANSAYSQSSGGLKSSQDAEATAKANLEQACTLPQQQLGKMLSEITGKLGLAKTYLPEIASASGVPGSPPAKASEKAGHGEINAAQKIGFAYVSHAHDQLQEARQTARNTKAILEELRHNKPHRQHSPHLGAGEW